MVSLEQAIEILRQSIDRIKDIEEVSLLSANGRVLADDVIADIDNPPFDRSPLDGFAVRAADTKVGQKLAVIGTVFAGGEFVGEIRRGQAVRIMTGAMLPKGCDAVIAQEDTAKDRDGTLAVFKKLAAGQNFVRRGEDYKKGDILLKQDTRLNSVALGVLASLGRAVVRVWRRPRVFLAATGDELTAPRERRARGKIYDSNLYMLAARLAELGCAVEGKIILPDDENFVKDTLAAAENADLIITTGGVSVGERDIMHEAVKKMAAKHLFWRVAVRPGSPVLAYRLGNSLGLALSGNPFAALATFELLARPVLAKLARDKNINYVRRRAVLADSFLKKSPIRRFVRGIYEDGRLFLTAKNSSGMLASATRCNALADIPKGSAELLAGDTVDVILL
jgi:molybdopterin molybdotransferase